MAKKKDQATEATPETTNETATTTNKSEAIRQVLEENPTFKAKQVVEHMKALGIDTTEGLVYQVLRKMKEKTGSNKPRKTASTPAPAKQAGQSVADAIAEVKALADKIGIDSLKVIANGLR